MVKNRNNKNKQRRGSSPMDIIPDQEVMDVPQAMDTSESKAPRPTVSAAHRKTKGVQMKRSKNMRKKKAIEKAISKTEKKMEKVLKHESKTSRILSAKKLYD